MFSRTQWDILLRLIIRPIYFFLTIIVRRLIQAFGDNLQSEVIKQIFII